MTSRGTPTHVHRRRSKHRPVDAPSVVRRFKDGPDRPPPGRYLLITVDGRTLAGGDDEGRVRELARGLQPGWTIEDTGRRPRPVVV